MEEDGSDEVPQQAGRVVSEPTQPRHTNDSHARQQHQQQTVVEQRTKAEDDESKETERAAPVLLLEPHRLTLLCYNRRLLLLLLLGPFLAADLLVLPAESIAQSAFSSPRPPIARFFRLVSTVGPITTTRLPLPLKPPPPLACRRLPCRPSPPPQPPPLPTSDKPAANYEPPNHPCVKQTELAAEGDIDGWVEAADWPLERNKGRRGGSGRSGMRRERLWSSGSRPLCDER